MKKKFKKNISYKLKLIHRASVIANSLSNLVNNITNGIHTMKCKLGCDNKKMRNVWNQTRGLRVLP